MSISSFLNASLQFLIKLVQSDMLMFITLGIALLALYGIITIIIQIILFFRRPKI